MKSQLVLNMQPDFMLAKVSSPFSRASALHSCCKTSLMVDVLQRILFAYHKSFGPRQARHLTPFHRLACRQVRHLQDMVPLHPHETLSDGHQAMQRDMTHHTIEIACVFRQLAIGVINAYTLHEPDQR